MDIDLIAQVGITIFGISSIFLVARKNKWGMVLGLLSQPFWFITTIVHHQWGIVLLNVIYSIMWTYGVYNWFHSERKEKEVA